MMQMRTLGTDLNVSAVGGDLPEEGREGGEVSF